jgi:hypothetical protein
METREAARRWARAWEQAWRGHDPEPLRRVYADGAVFRSSPFVDPRPPLEYAAWAFEDERSAEPRFGEPVVDGDRAAVAWWTTVVNDDGREQTIAGSSHLRFDSDGLVAEEHGYWNLTDGHVEPFAGWARPDG